MKFLAIILIIAFAGCASYTTQQEDISYVGTNVVRRLSTRVTIRTILDGRSELSKSSVTMTDKSQSSRIGTASQFATNNIPDAVGKVAEGVVRGLK